MLTRDKEAGYSYTRPRSANKAKYGRLMFGSCRNGSNEESQALFPLN